MALDLGGFVQLTGPVAGGVAAFAVEIATGDVLAVDVATGKPRWRTPAPKAASLPKPSAKSVEADRNLFGMRTGPGTSVSLTLDKGALPFLGATTSNPASRLRMDAFCRPSVHRSAAMTGRRLPSRWRVMNGAINEVDGARRSFSMPAFIAAAPDLAVQDDRRVPARLCKWVMADLLKAPREPLNQTTPS
jgi:hypothetical protein